MVIGGKIVEESSQCKNLGVVKNHAVCFQPDISETTKRTKIKVEAILNWCTDGMKTNYSIHIKSWRQGCLLTSYLALDYKF